MKVKVSDLKPGDIIRFTDPNSPDVQVTGYIGISDTGPVCDVMPLGDNGLPASDAEGSFWWESLDEELEVVYRGRQYVHPGISTTDEGDDLSRLNLEFQEWLSRNASLEHPILNSMIRRLNELINPDA